MSATATLPHSDRLMTREGPPAGSAADVELAVEHLASLMADTHGDQLSALEAVARAATRLARAHRREVPLEEDRPVVMVGAWSLDNGMLPHIVLGEN
ncbi:MAG: hypothetical protein QOE72_4791 [Chloroflexota bacterium]|nr:hypothetical protein [Chloroflexota bacterium]